MIVWGSISELYGPCSMYHAKIKFPLTRNASTAIKCIYIRRVAQWESATLTR